jgi:phage gp29-like protein
MAKNKKFKHNMMGAAPSRSISVNKGVDARKYLKANGFDINQPVKLDVRAPLRRPLDLGVWRNGQKQFDSIMAPRRVVLYDLYNDILADAHIIAVMGKRIDAITTTAWQYVDKDGKPIDEINELLDSLGFADLLTEILNARFWGYSMIDCNIYQDAEGRWQMDANQYNRKHMRPEMGIVAIDQNGDDGINIREGRYAHTVLEAGKVRDMGLLVSASMYAILKRNNLSDWANFVEVFGAPIMDAEWDGFDEDQRLKLLAAISAMGNSGRLVRPAGTKVNFFPHTSTATGQLQKTFHDTCNDEISKSLLGSTETTESSKTSGYAQATEHGKQDDAKKEADKDYVRRHLNTYFIKIMRAFGVPVVNGGKFIIPEAQEEVSPVDKMAMFVQMATSLNMPINHDDVYQLTGMKKPEDYEQQMSDKNALADALMGDFEANPGKESAITPPAKSGKSDKNGAKEGEKPGNVKLNYREKLALYLLDFFG